MLWVFLRKKKYNFILKIVHILPALSLWLENITSCTSAMLMIHPYICPWEMSEIQESTLTLCSNLTNFDSFFNTSHLDYWNLLYVELSHFWLTCSQSKIQQWDYISPVLASLHWLPVRYRVDFKNLTFVFITAWLGISLHLWSPHPVFYSISRSFRSSDQLLLSVSCSQSKSRGHTAFYIAAARLWNSLPFKVRPFPSVASFKFRLKTHLYVIAFESQVLVWHNLLKAL